MIHKEDIDKIFEAARVEEVVADYVSLKKRGANLIGCCPFHNEKTPSFYVSPAKGIYKCFGCGKGGHAINFIMEHDKLTYPDALRYLAKKYNIEITEEEQTPEQVQFQNDRESLLVVSSFAQKHFSENLYNTDEGKSIGLGYFKERGLREDIIQKFQLGYSINQRTAFTDIAIATGYKTEYLVKAGLTIEFKNEPEINPEESEIPVKAAETRYIDRFSGRVMFPIQNQSGRVIAFGGRTLRSDKKVAKYVNSPETEIYHKSDVLYGLFQSKNAIQKEKFCFLVEGYMDVIAMHQAGVENVVASSGTALTAGQIKLIQRFTNDIIISYDGDQAGINAALKGIDLLLEEGMNVKVLLFPDGDDPDSYSKKVSTQELKDFIVTNAQNFISYKASILTKGTNNDPLRKAEAIKKIVESIALIPDAIYRSVYVKECSRIMDVDEQILLSELNKIRNKNFNDKRNQHLTPSEGEGADAASHLESFVEKKEHTIADAEHQEREIIRLLINYGGSLIKIDSENESGEPIEVDVSVAYVIIQELKNDTIILENLLYNTAYNEFVEHLEKDVIPDINYFINHENSALSSLTIDLISEPYFLSNWEQHGIYPPKEIDILKHSAYKAIYTLKCRKLEMMIYNIQKRIKDNPPEEELMTLLQTNISLQNAYKVFNNILGRIIVK
ncbi:MAG: DNA primase [Bacteroidetes bacterium]|nr:DNA primase [Bacteroidota bacterium]